MSAKGPPPGFGKPASTPRRSRAEAWRQADQPVLCMDRLPEPDQAGRTTWVTRARPKIIRIACPWLIRRFIDPTSVFLYVAPSEVAAVAKRFAATPFDCGDGIWNDRGDTCTFDVMLEEFNLKTEPLSRLAAIIRGAETGLPDLTSQSGGLLAISLGYSRMFKDEWPSSMPRCRFTTRCTAGAATGPKRRTADRLSRNSAENHFTRIRDRRRHEFCHSVRSRHLPARYFRRRLCRRARRFCIRYGRRRHLAFCPDAGTDDDIDPRIRAAGSRLLYLAAAAHNTSVATLAVRRRKRRRNSRRHRDS
jgi:hypothetical protein